VVWKQTNGQTDRQTDKPTNKQTNKQLKSFINIQQQKSKNKTSMQIHKIWVLKESGNRNDSYASS